MQELALIQLTEWHNIAAAQISVTWCGQVRTQLFIFCTFCQKTFFEGLKYFEFQSLSLIPFMELLVNRKVFLVSPYHGGCYTLLQFLQTLIQ